MIDITNPNRMEKGVNRCNETHQYTCTGLYIDCSFQHVTFCCNFNDVKFVRCVFDECIFLGNLFKLTSFDNCIFRKPMFIENRSFDHNIRMTETDLNGATFIRDKAKYIFERTHFNTYISIHDSDITGWVLTGCTGFKNSPMACPSKGEFTAYKKAIGFECSTYRTINFDGSTHLHDWTSRAGEVIVELTIPEDAKRSSATSHKCRADKTIVKRVLDFDGKDISYRISKLESIYDKNFEYQIGDTLTVDNFDNNRYEECAPGIHFFVDFEAAVNY